jgi:hypothetical protein
LLIILTFIIFNLDFSHFDGVDSDDDDCNNDDDLNRKDKGKGIDTNPNDSDENTESKDKGKGIDTNPNDSDENTESKEKEVIDQRTIDEMKKREELYKSKSITEKLARMYERMGI